MLALWLVNQLWFIVPLNSNSNFKFRVSSELLCNSNRPHVFMVYRLINHLGCWKNTRSIRKSLACSSWFKNSSRLLPTSRVAYHPINHKNLWSIDQLSAGNALPSCTQYMKQQRHCCAFWQRSFKPYVKSGYKKYNCAWANLFSLILFRTGTIQILHGTQRTMTN